MKLKATLGILLLCAASAAAAQSNPNLQQQAAARAAAERRQAMIGKCMRDHGSEKDCTREADTELRAEGLQSGGRVIHLRPRLPM
jgi:hypothetical protein